MEEVAGANRGFVVPSILYLAANMAPNSHLGSVNYFVLRFLCARAPEQLYSTVQSRTWIEIAQITRLLLYINKFLKSNLQPLK